MEPPNAAFHLGLHCQCLHLGFTSIQRVLKNVQIRLFDVLHPIQLFFSHVRIISCVPWLNQF